MSINETNSSIEDVEAALQSAKEILQDAVKLSLKSIKHNPTMEKEFIELWSNHTKELSDYFFAEAEESGNEEVAKNLIKYIMFKRY